MLALGGGWEEKGVSLVSHKPGSHGQNTTITAQPCPGKFEAVLASGAKQEHTSHSQGILLCSIPGWMRSSSLPEGCTNPNEALAP